MESVNADDVAKKFFLIFAGCVGAFSAAALIFAF